MMQFKKKKETEGKIYSPVGNLAERAKQWIMLFYKCRWERAKGSCNYGSPVYYLLSSVYV